MRVQYRWPVGMPLCRALGTGCGKFERASNISRKGLAEKMKTSRSQISRLLDPKDGNVTLSTLQRAAKMVGRSLRLELV
jgi:transcriptional regulator with XRE-family HTH domain